MDRSNEKSMFLKEGLWRGVATIDGLFVIGLTLIIGAFLVYKGSATFLKFGHTLGEFLGSSKWSPVDNSQGGGAGALIFISGSLVTCGLALLIATPLSLGSAIFMTEISKKFGEKFFRPVVQIFAGIPSVVYGWVGLTVLVPAIKSLFHLQVGQSILAAGMVLAVMNFPTITSVASDAIAAVPKSCKDGAYGLGSTRWQAIYRVIIPAAKSGVIKEDDAVDDYFNDIYKSLSQGMSKQDRSSLDLMMIAKYYERIGDHATNIAEWVIYSITNEFQSLEQK